MRKTPLGWLAGLFLFLLIPVYAHAAGEITVFNSDYDLGTPHHTKLSLSVNVQSEYEIQKVTAKVDDREVELELADCGAGCTWWAADFPLDGLKQGVKTLTITAFDYAGRTGTITKKFLHDAPPEVQITGVSKHHVVQNSKFRALVSTKDELSIPVIRVSLSTADRVIETLEAKGSLDHEFDLTAYKDQIVTYRVQVYDFGVYVNRNLRFSSEYQLYVDPSSTLIPVDSVEGTIVDFDDTRTLYYGTDYRMRIKNRTDGTETIIYNPPNYGLGMSLLTPTGALMRAFCGKDCAQYFLWNSGQLKDTGIWASTDFFAQTNGKYAFSGYTGDLIDTETGEIRNFGRVGNVALAANGSFVEANNEGITLFQPDGTSSQLIKTRLEYPSLVSDGKTVLLNTNSRDILKYADGSLTEISKSISDHDITSPHSDFEINQGWIAYTKPTPSGRRQIFLESPQGTVTQVTYFNGNPKIRALNEHGTLAITYNSDLYMYHPGDQEPKKLISDSLNISYHNGAWYQAVEGTLFRLNDAPGDTTAPQWPVGDVLSVTDVTYNSVQLNWQPATDETAVDKYLLYQDNTLLDTLNGDVSSYEVKWLSPKSSYLFSLVAVDAVGNQSVKQEVTVTTAAYATPFQLSDSKTYSYGGSNYEFLLYYGYISSSGQELSGSWSPPEGFHGVVKVSMASPYGEDYDLSLETVGEGNRLPEDTTLLTNGTEYSAAEVPAGYRAEWRVKGHTGNDYSPDKKVFVYVSIKYDNH